MWKWMRPLCLEEKRFAHLNGDRYDANPANVRDEVEDSPPRWQSRTRRRVVER